MMRGSRGQPFCFPVFFFFSSERKDMLVQKRIFVGVFSGKKNNLTLSNASLLPAKSSLPASSELSYSCAFPCAFKDQCNTPLISGSIGLADLKIFVNFLGWISF